MPHRPTRIATPALARLLAALLALVFLVPPAAAQEIEPVYGWDDDPPTPADLADWNPDIREAPWFENWDFWLWADDGTFIFVQFLTSSFGFGIERNASARMIIVSPDAYNRGSAAPGVSFADRGWEWENGDWSWEEVPLNLTFRDCHIRGDGEAFEIFLRGRRRETFFEMNFTLEAPLHRPGDGRIEYGWDRHRYYDQQAMPRFSWTGRVNRKESRDDEDNWQALSGVGYGEHTLANDFHFELASRFLGFRALRPDGLTIAIDGLTLPIERGGRNISWALVSLDGEPLFEATDVVVLPTDVRTFEAPDGTEYEVPYGYIVEATNGDDAVRVVVSNSDLISAESPFARVGAFLRAVLGAMMAPYDFELSADYNAWIRIDGQTAEVSGRGWTTTNFSQ